MGFSEKAKRYFYDELKLDNRAVAKRMGNYSESLVSRYLNSDKISATFILKIRKYFPEADVEEWMDSNSVEKRQEDYQISPVKRINRMISELEELKKEIKKMSQK
jgi:plasmid maintenance system antidote protein VapI